MTNRFFMILAIISAALLCAAPGNAETPNDKSGDVAAVGGQQDYTQLWPENGPESWCLHGFTYAGDVVQSISVTCNTYWEAWIEGGAGNFYLTLYSSGGSQDMQTGVMYGNQTIYVGCNGYYASGQEYDRYGSATLYMKTTNGDPDGETSILLDCGSHHGPGSQCTWCQKYNDEIP